MSRFGLPRIVYLLLFFVAVYFTYSYLTEAIRNSSTGNILRTLVWAALGIYMLLRYRARSRS